MTFDDVWMAHLAALKSFVSEFSGPPAKIIVGPHQSLSMWCYYQRRLHKAGKLPGWRAALLNAVPLWEWDVPVRVRPAPAAWEARFGMLQSYIAANGRYPIDRTIYQNFKLGAWCSGQRRRYRAGTLPRERVEQLNTLPLWEWEYGYEAVWLATFDVLRSYMALTGRVPSCSATHQGVNIGNWCRKQRDHRHRLTAVREEQLNSLPGWRW